MILHGYFVLGVGDGAVQAVVHNSCGGGLQENESLREKQKARLGSGPSVTALISEPYEALAEAWASEPWT